jgi:hypothetical protein
MTTPLQELTNSELTAQVQSMQQHLNKPYSPNNNPLHEEMFQLIYNDLRKEMVKRGLNND